MPNIYKQYKFLGRKSFLIIKDFNMIDEITMNELRKWKMNFVGQWCCLLKLKRNKNIMK